MAVFDGTKCKNLNDDQIYQLYLTINDQFIENSSCFTPSFLEHFKRITWEYNYSISKLEKYETATVKSKKLAKVLQKTKKLIEELDSIDDPSIVSSFEVSNLKTQNFFAEFKDLDMHYESRSSYSEESKKIPTLSKLKKLLPSYNEKQTFSKSVPLNTLNFTKKTLLTFAKETSSQISHYESQKKERGQKNGNLKDFQNFFKDELLRLYKNHTIPFSFSAESRDNDQIDNIELFIGESLKALQLQSDIKLSEPNSFFSEDKQSRLRRFIKEKYHQV